MNVSPDDNYDYVKHKGCLVKKRKTAVRVSVHERAVVSALHSADTITSC